jgi:WD40 repeat protein
MQFKPHWMALSIKGFRFLLAGIMLSTLSYACSFPINPENFSYQLSLTDTVYSPIAQAVAWSPDGSTFVIATTRTIDIYDAESHEQVDSIEIGQTTRDIRYDPQGKLLAIALEDGSLQLWDFSQRNRLALIECLDLQCGEDLSPDIAFNFDGSLLAIAIEQTVFLYDIPSGKMIQTYPGLLDSVTSIEFNPQGDLLMIAAGRKIVIRDLTTGDLLYPAVQLEEDIVCALFDRGTAAFFVVTNFWNSDFSTNHSHLSKWDLATGTLLAEYEPIQGYVHQAMIDIRKGVLFLFSDSFYALVSLNDPTQINITRISESSFRSIALSPDGSKFLTAGGHWGGYPQLGSLTSSTLIKSFDQYSLRPMDAVFSPAGDLVAIKVASDRIDIKKTDSGERLFSFRGRSPMAFSLDGNILAYAGFTQPSQYPRSSCDDNNELILVDTMTGDRLPVKISCPDLSAVAFSPVGGLVAFGSNGYGGPDVLKIIDQNGHPVINLSDVIREHNLYFQTLSFSPDGSQVFLIDNNRVTSLDTQTGDIVQDYQTEYSASLTLSPNGRYLVDSVFDYTTESTYLEISDIPSHQVLYRWLSAQSPYSKKTFSPDGQFLVIAGTELELWDAWNGHPLSRVEEIGSELRALSFNQRGDTLLLLDEDGTIQHWSITRKPNLGFLSRPSPTFIPTPTPTQTVEQFHPDKLATFGKGISSNVYYSPDGKLAAFIQGTQLVWSDTETFNTLGTIEIGENASGGLVFSPDGKLIVVDTYMGAIIADLGSREIVGGLSGGNGSTFGYTFSRDSQYLAYTVADRTTGGPYYQISVWSAASQSVLGDYDSYPTLLRDRYHTMSPPAISPDGVLLAAGHDDKRVYIWNLLTGETRLTLEGHARDVNSVDFSPNGTLLASGSADGTVRLWNPWSGKLVRVLTGFKTNVMEVSFSADGGSLTVGVADHPDQLVDLQSGEITDAPLLASTPDPFILRQYQEGYSSRSGSLFSAVSFSPDGRMLAMTSNNVLLWDVASHKLLHFLDNSQGGVIRGLSFSADNKRLAVTTDDDRVLAWDTQSGNRIFSQPGQFLTGASVYYGIGDDELGPARSASYLAEQGLAFSPDGRYLAFNNDNLLEIWDVENSTRQASLVNPEGLYATQFSFSADGKRLYAILNRNRAAQIWEVGSGKLIRQIDLPDVDPNAFSAAALNGPLFARNNSQVEQDACIELWNLETGTVIKLNMPSVDNEPLRFNQDGAVLMAMQSEVISFWETSSGRLILRLDSLDEPVDGFDLSPDKHFLVTASRGIAQLWNLGDILNPGRIVDLPAATPQPSVTPPVFAWPTQTPRPVATGMAPIGLDDPDYLSSSNVSNMKELARFGLGAVNDVTWSPTGDAIFVSGSFGVIEFDLDPLTGSLIPGPIQSVSGGSERVGFTADGRILSSTGITGHATVWDITNDTSLAEMESNGDAVISPDGSLLVYGTSDDDLVIWDLASQTSVVTLPGYSYSPVFSPDGRWLAALRQGNYYLDSVRVWNLKTGDIVNALGGPDNTITSLSFSQDGNFVTAAAGGSAWIWELRPGLPPNEFDFYEVDIVDNLNVYAQYVTATALSPNNQLVAIATSENQLQLYERISHRILLDLEGPFSPIHLLRFSPDGTSLLSVDEDGSIAVWDVATGIILGEYSGFLGATGGVTFLQDGSLSVWGTGTNRVIDPLNGNLMHSTHVQNGKILASSPAGDLLAVYNPFQMSVWDADTGRLIKTLEGEAIRPFVDYQYEGTAFRQFYAAAFNQDGSVLATAGTGGVWVYDTSNLELTTQISGNNCQKLAINPLGDQILSALNDHAQYITAFDLNTNESVFSFGVTGNETYQVAFSPDGRWAGAVTRGWNQPYQLIVVHPDTEGYDVIDLGEEVPGVSLAFNPASTLVAVGFADGTIQLIDLENLKLISTLTGHQDAVIHLAFSADGLLLVSRSLDGTVRTWGIP